MQKTDTVTVFAIPESTENIVIFVHGFGVRWDSRGMFTDIQQSLPKHWGSVLFDFYKVDGHDVTITPISEQVRRLLDVIRQTKERAPQATLHIIAHSKGCIITALAKPDITGNTILLAPPESFGTKLRRYFEQYPNAKEENEELVIPRKDGTTTHIPLSFFPETQRIAAEKAIQELSLHQPIHLLQTTKDEVIGNTTYTMLQHHQNIVITPMPADHNFTGHYREELLLFVQKTIGY